MPATESNQSFSYRLGLDLGSNSIGWAVVALDGDAPEHIERCGVRIFAAGVEGSLEQGREESRAVKRRQMRLQRRQINRRRRRDQKVFRVLQSWGLLPASQDSPDRTAYFNALDRDLASNYLAKEYPGIANLPYFLRARALDHQLQRFELGRALYHVSQRRGFLSNRKISSRESDEERGKVKTGIAQLLGEMELAGARTLGEYFSRLDPLTDHRIRGRWTRRDMYTREFDAIWAAQAAFHPETLTEQRRGELFHAIFHQRPLRDQEDLIGECELAPGEKRAPLWHPLSQRFRMLQVVNDLRIIDRAGLERSLTDEERSRLVQALETEGDLTWARIRKILELQRHTEFNRQSGGETRLVGDRTAAKLRDVFLDAWDRLSESEQLEAARNLAEGIEEESLFQKAVERWGLNELKAREYAELHLESGKYVGYSLAALRRIVPRMEMGEAFSTARKHEFPESFATGVALESLPPVKDAASDIRNPAVVRTLTELRRLVNALIRRYGKPEEIHIELARDLKQARPERERRWKRMREQQQLREKAAHQITKDAGLTQPSTVDIEKMMLAMECRCHCPYTGRPFSITALMSGEIQVEHIIPFSRSLDDSYLNKTLCFADENKQKGNRTPWEHYGKAGSPEWDAIVERVSKFDSPLAKEKLRRFQMREEDVSELLANFSERQLNDTRYASKLAAKYLAVLYGGLWDETGKLRIYATGGQVTAYLRRLWSLNRVLSNGDVKTRDNHKHHAVDAVVIALSDPSWIKALADAADQASSLGRRRFASIVEPWPAFVDETRAVVQSLLVSHRPDRGIGGGFHDETLYSRRTGKDGEEIVSTRKPVTSLEPAEIDKIVDPAVRERVKLQFGIVGGDTKKMQGDNAPTLPTRDGRHIPIRSVRIKIGRQVRSIGADIRQRNVMGGDNQHFEVFAVLDSVGEVKRWDCAIVSKQEAAERVRRKEPVARRRHGPNTRFEFTITKNDILEIGPPGNRRLVVVRGLETDRRVGISDIDDARKISSKAGNRERLTVNKLMADLGCRKVSISPLGYLLPCRD